MKFNVVHIGSGRELYLNTDYSVSDGVVYVENYWECDCDENCVHLLPSYGGIGVCDLCDAQHDCCGDAKLSDWVKQFDPDVAWSYSGGDFSMGDVFDFPEQVLSVSDDQGYDHITVKLSKILHPVAWKQKVICFMSSGCSESEAEQMAGHEDICLDLYYERNIGLMAVESIVVENNPIYSPYTKQRYSDGEVESTIHNNNLLKKDVSLGGTTKQKFDDFKLLQNFCYGEELKSWVDETNYLSASPLVRGDWYSLMNDLVLKIEEMQIVDGMGRFGVGAINFGENYTGFINDFGNRLIQAEGSTRCESMLNACMLFVKLHYAHDGDIPKYSGLLYEA